ncbi:MAG: class I SAM-dependent methyltransferase [Candidatus Eremiobacteraeota bacterium]|nr:class I SAM-dependent methyltransferase [Candidatus Eremiobacteraeota bacterium]
MNADYAKLANDFDAGRIGYSTDLYSAITEYGFPSNGKILDLACGTGLASGPLAAAGAHITGIDTSSAMLEFARERLPGATFVEGKAEKLPFKQDEFDGAICAQAFHWLDRQKAIDELIRVVKPRGIVAIWWKQIMADDPVNMMRDEVASGLKVTVPPSGLTGGFLEFYGAPFSDHTLRVIPWRMATSLDRYIGYERSRRSLNDAFGDKVEPYIEKLTERLRGRFGPGNPLISIGYLQFLYLGRTL